VAQAIAKEIKIALSPLEEKLLSNAPVVNPEAYEAYLMGRFHLYQLTPDHYQVALEYYQKALEIDPDYSLAHAGVAQVWLHRGLWAGYHPLEAVKIAKASALKALDIDPNAAEGHQVLAMFYYSYEWQWKKAISEFETAIELSPNHPEPKLFYGDLLLSMNQPAEALSQIRAAVAMDPLNAFSYCILGWALYATRQYQEAVEELEKSLEMQSTLSLSLRCLWSIHHIQGQHPKSLEYAKLFYQAQGMPEVAHDLEVGNEKEGYYYALKYAADRLEEHSKQTFVPAMRIARLYAQAGQVDKAVELLEKSYDERFPSMISLNVDPDWDPLAKSKRFQDLLKKMNFPD
jgi:tetratricopeptide (TPR) repeat protein